MKFVQNFCGESNHLEDGERDEEITLRWIVGKLVERWMDLAQEHFHLHFCYQRVG
jgi:hypothetical protein